MFVATGMIAPPMGPVVVSSLTREEAQDARVNMARRYPTIRLVITYQDEPRENQE